MTDAGTILMVRERAERVSDKTVWLFVEIASTSGLVGCGEATLSGHADVVAERIRQVGAGLVGSPIDPALLPPLAGATLVEAAARSALDLALRDLCAQARGERLRDALGGAQRDGVPIYANINRRTLDRSPAGFAASVADAIAAGFTAFKIAPFDEATPAVLAEDPQRRCLQPGLARIAAVRERIGEAAELMVDCHWRLDEPATEAVLAAVEPLRLYWLECPLVESAENLPALVRLRGHANVRGIRLAGCEQSVGLDGFAPFLAAGAYDVMMPDVKYVGGLDEVMRVADAFRRAGVDFSPHNPSGPICHAASLHVSAAAPGFTRLEMQFDESPMFDSLVGGGLPAIHGGVSGLPRSAGLGVRLQPA